MTIAILDHSRGELTLIEADGDPETVVANWADASGVLLSSVSWQVVNRIIRIP